MVSTDERTTVTSAELLKSYAEHFAPRDWDYTRLNKIKYIRYDDDFKGYYAPHRRVKRALSGLFERPSKSFLYAADQDAKWLKRVWFVILHKVAIVRVSLRTKDHLPDGVLNGGSVITFWEEDGEYLQMVQPSVGSLLADFLIAEPEHPHARKITAELDRLSKSYDARIKRGEVDGTERK